MAEPILHQVATGHADAMQVCLDYYGGLVWTLARRMTGSREAAIAAVQEIFAELWSCAPRFDARAASETAFVAAIARHCLAERRRAERSANLWGPLDGDADGEFEDEPHPMETSDEAERAVAAMRMLRPEQQEVLKLSIFEGLSEKEVARKTGLPLSMVKTNARRALMRVRQVLTADFAGMTPGVA